MTGEHDQNVLDQSDEQEESRLPEPQDTDDAESDEVSEDNSEDTSDDASEDAPDETPEEASGDSSQAAPTTETKPKKKSKEEKPAAEKPNEDLYYMHYTCPACGNEKNLTIPRDPLIMAHNLQAKGLYPVDNIFVYQVTIQNIREFLYEKAKRYEPSIKMLDVVPIFTSRSKKGKPAEPGHSYAALQVVMSSESIDDELKQYGFFGKLGIDDDRVKVRKDLYNCFVRRYVYNREALDADLKSYKKLEEYENIFGMSEEYLSTLMAFSIPRLTKAQDGKDYVIFAANPIKVFNDMFLTAQDKKRAGSVMKLVDTTKMDGDMNIVYTIHLHSSGVGMDRPTDHLVKAMLRGEAKGK